MSSVDEIILGEGVAIDSGAAPVTLRIGSGLIDLLVYGAAFVGLLYFTAPLVARSNEALAAAIVVALVVLAFVVVPASVETLTRGLSAGRLAVGLRIVRDDSGPVTARHAFGRALVGFLEIFATFGLVAVAASMVSERGKRLGDMLVGTYAMR
ncbi:MAG: RDD family protein, partial [Actinomycetes bacterium]